MESQLNENKYGFPYSHLSDVTIQKYRIIIVNILIVKLGDDNKHTVYDEGKALRCCKSRGCTREFISQTFLYNDINLQFLSRQKVTILM